MPIEFNLPTIPAADTTGAAAANGDPAADADAFLALFLSASGMPALSGDIRQSPNPESGRDRRDGIDGGMTRETRDDNAGNRDAAAMLGLLLTAAAPAVPVDSQVRTQATGLVTADTVVEHASRSRLSADLSPPPLANGADELPASGGSRAQGAVLASSQGTAPRSAGPDAFAADVTGTFALPQMTTRIAESANPVPAVAVPPALALAGAAAPREAAGAPMHARLDSDAGRAISGASRSDTPAPSGDHDATVRAAMPDVMPGEPGADAGRAARMLGGGDVRSDMPGETRARTPVDSPPSRTAHDAIASTRAVALQSAIANATPASITATTAVAQVATAPSQRDMHSVEAADPAFAAAFGIQSAASTPAPAPVVTIHAPVGTPEWRTEIAQQMATLAVKGHDRAELQLHPVELGPIDVRVSMEAGQATLIITAVQPATRDALELALPQLRDALAQQGIALGQATVNDQRPRDFAGSRDARSGSDGASRGVRVDTGAAEATSAPMPARARGLVDTFA